MSIEIDNLKASGLNLQVLDLLVTGTRGYYAKDKIVRVRYLFKDNQDALKFVEVINKLREDSAKVSKKPLPQLTLPQLTRTIDRKGCHIFEEVSFRLRIGHYLDVYTSIQCGKYTLSYTPHVEKRNMGGRIKKYLLELTCKEDNEKYYLFHRTCDKEINETSIIDALPSGEYPTHVIGESEGILLQCNANKGGCEKYDIYHIPGSTGTDLFVEIKYMVEVFLEKVSDLKDEVEYEITVDRE